jgi:hypothetical protein
MINMKSTKKNGAKRNPILALAILGLLVGAGATGALAAGLIPNLDTGVSGSVSADVSTIPLLTVSANSFVQDQDATVATTYNSAGDSVKFTSDTMDIIAPGSANFSLCVTLNRLGVSANSLLINMKGIDEYTIVSATANDSLDHVVPISYMGAGEWAITGIDGGDIATKYTLVFNIFVSQETVRIDGAHNPLWDFSITEASITSTNTVV